MESRDEGAVVGENGYKEKTDEKVEQQLQAHENMLGVVDESRNLQHNHESGWSQGSVVDDQTLIGKFLGTGDSNINGSVGVNEDTGVCGDKVVWSEACAEIDHEQGQAKMAQITEQLAEIGGVPLTVTGLVQPGVASESAMVIESLKPSECTGAGDGRDAEDSQFHEGGPGDTFEKYESSADQVVADSTTVGVKQGQATASDNHTEDVQTAHQPGHQGRGQRPSQFPALDIVDLESDDDVGDRDSGNKGNTDAAADNVGVSRDKLEEKVTGDGLKTTTLNDSNIQLQALPPENVGVHVCEAEDMVCGMDGLRDIHKEFPLNYQNYKVCRELSPGVKQCLILETGEQYIFVTEHKQGPDGSPGPPVEGMDFQRPVFQSGVDDDDVPTTANVPSEAATFSYTILQKDGRGMPDARSPKGLDSSQQSSGAITVLGKPKDADNCMLYDEDAERKSSLKASRRAKADRFVELQPESNDNVNNNSNEQDLNGATNTNKNAVSHSKPGRFEQRGDVSIRASQYPSDRPYHTDRGGQAHSYDHYTPGSRGVSTAGSRMYPQSTSRESTYSDSRSHGSGEGSSYYRSRNPSSTDTSLLSTRYTHVERGDPRSCVSRPESVTIPKFKTLHDQQVNWLEMFKMIEQQHRTELQSQYQEHQKILQEMQKNMEKELIKQQDTLKQRLLTHREMLEELSPSRPATMNINQSWAKNDRDSVSMDSRASSDIAVANNTSHITLQGVPVALRNPPPMSRYHHDTRQHKPVEELPVKRSLDKEFSSPVRPADTSLNMLPQAVSIDRDKQLRGGVYSSPFPLAKVKHKRSPRASKSYENVSHESLRDEASHNTNSVHWVHNRRDESKQSHGSADVSLTESEEVLSPRTRVALKEKHAKHMADMQAYHEKELQGVARESGSLRMTAADKILASENQELQEKYRELQEAYHDAKIEIRELQQKIQGLEIRSTDYAERYSATQSQVLTLKSRLEELADYAREKEATIADLSNKERKNAESLQMAYKTEKELAEALHNAKSTIQKLVDKYEMLEKDHDILKETSAETQGKLYSSRTEIMEANNKLSRLEVENKQLKRDVENLRHHLTIAQGAATMHTSYEDSYHRTVRSPDRAHSAYSSIYPSSSRPPERSSNGHSGDRQTVRSDNSPESDSDNDYSQSPLMKAERELKKLQASQEFTPKLQRKFYGTERPASYSDPLNAVNRTSGHSLNSPHSAKIHSPQNKGAQITSQGRESSSKPTVSISSYFSRSQREGSRQSKENEKTSSYLNYKDGNSNRNHNVTPKKPSSPANGLTSDQAIERVKSGEIVARPAWEDIYTSLSSSRHGGPISKGSSMNHARDQIFRERLQNIENLEKKYEDLTNEKRKHESALSKLSGHGHGRERDRLESELDRVDRELGSVRMSLKRYHVLKSTI